MMEPEFSKTFENTRTKRAALERTRLPTGPHYPIVVEMDFRVTPHATRILLGEDLFAARNGMPNTLPEGHVKIHLRTMADKLRQVLFCGIAPFAADGYPIIMCFYLSE